MATGNAQQPGWSDSQIKVLPDAPVAFTCGLREKEISNISDLLNAAEGRPERSPSKTPPQ